MLPFLCALFASQASQPSQAYPALPPQTVKETVRLAETPVLEGKIDDGEWQPFTDSSSSPTYLQWEPGTVYWAAKASATSDIVLSYDSKGDGWLIGDDNIEIRASIKDANVVLSVRRLDATDPAGPKWVDSGIAPEAIKVSTKMSGDHWELEGSLDLSSSDAVPQAGSRVGARIDVVPASTDFGPAYVPRAVSFLRFGMDSSSGLFSGMTWHPILPERNYSKEESLNLKYDFHVAPECPLLRSIEIQGLGPAAEGLPKTSDAFPPLGRDRNISVNYKNPLSGMKTLGYRVIEAKITAADGTPCYLRTSFLLSEPIDVFPMFPATVTASTDAKIVHADIEVKSITERRVEGDMHFTVPKEWTITRGQGGRFSIVRPRGRAKLPVEFIVPKGTKGVFPIDVTLKSGDRSVTKTQYIRVI